MYISLYRKCFYIFTEIKCQGFFLRLLLKVVCVWPSGLGKEKKTLIQKRVHLEEHDILFKRYIKNHYLVDLVSFIFRNLYYSFIFLYFFSVASADICRDRKNHTERSHSSIIGKPILIGYIACVIQLYYLRIIWHEIAVKEKYIYWTYSELVLKQKLLLIKICVHGENDSILL